MKKTVYLTSKQDGLKLHVLLMDQNNLQRESYRSATVWQNIKNAMSLLCKCCVTMAISV